MNSTAFKVTFSINEEDAAYFRSRFRKAKAAARKKDREEILDAAGDLVETVRRAKRTPKFVLEAIVAIEDLVDLIEDEAYRAPKAVANQVLAALAYFANPDDLIPDDIPVLGFLDDAIMIKFCEREFKHELAAYRKFRSFRRGAEQRPWTDVASNRLPGRLKAQRAKLRAEVEKRKKADEKKGVFGF